MTDESEEPEWLTDMDKQILEVLSDDLILTPSIIAENISRSRKGVSNRLNSLQAGGLIEKIERGKYRITEKGKSMLEQIDQRKFRARRSEIVKRRLIRREFGISKKEYEKALTKEIKASDAETDEAIEEAIERAEEKLRKSNSESDRS